MFRNYSEKTYSLLIIKIFFTRFNHSLSRSFYTGYMNLNNIPIVILLRYLADLE